MLPQAYGESHGAIRAVLTRVRVVSLIATIGVVACLMKQDTAVLHFEHAWHDSLLTTALWSDDSGQAALRDKTKLRPWIDSTIIAKADDYIRAHERTARAYTTVQASGKPAAQQPSSTMAAQSQSSLCAPLLAPCAPPASSWNSDKSGMDDKPPLQAVQHPVVAKTASESPTTKDHTHASKDAATVSPSAAAEAATIGIDTAQEIEEEDIRDLGGQIIRSLQEKHQREERGRLHTQASEEAGSALRKEMSVVGAVEEVSKIFQSFKLSRAFEHARALFRHSSSPQPWVPRGWGSEEHAEGLWIRKNLSVAAIAPIAPLQPPPAPAMPPPPPPVPASTTTSGQTAGPLPPRTCRGLLTETAPEGAIDTGAFQPQGGGQRAAGADCRWLFDIPHASALQLSFSSFHLSGEHGHVFVYSGAEMVQKNLGVHHALDAASAFHTYTGLEPPRGVLYVPTGEVLVIFQSEPSDAGAGFNLSWTSERDDAAASDPPQT